MVWAICAYVVVLEILSSTFTPQRKFDMDVELRPNGRDAD
jgi:hypothetical protein